MAITTTAKHTEVFEGIQVLNFLFLLGFFLNSYCFFSSLFGTSLFDRYRGPVNTSYNIVNCKYFFSYSLFMMADILPYLPEL